MGFALLLVAIGYFLLLIEYKKLKKSCCFNKHRYFVNGNPITFDQDLENINYAYFDVKDLIQMNKDVIIPYLKIPPISEGQLFEIRIVNSTKTKENKND